MNALIFAAGLGTRLKPLTDTMPKALVPVSGKPLLHHLIDRLKSSVDDDGQLSVVCNIHHFGQQIIDYAAANDNFGIDIQFSDERELLLETGGGMKRALPLFRNSDPVLVHNVDILSNIDLRQFYESHSASTDAVATMLVSQRDTKRYLLFSPATHRLVGWTNIATNEVRSPYPGLNPDDCLRYAFSGIQIVSPQILPLMNDWHGKFSIIDFYLCICDKVPIYCDFRSDLRLLDVGKIDVLAQAEEFVATYIR